MKASRLSRGSGGQHVGLWLDLQALGLQRNRCLSFQAPPSQAVSGALSSQHQLTSTTGTCDDGGHRHGAGSGAALISGRVALGDLANLAASVSPPAKRE